MSRRIDPFDAIFGKKNQEKKITSTIEEYENEVELVNNFKQLSIINRINTDNNNNQQNNLNKEIKALLEHTPIPESALDETGNIKSEILNQQADVDAEEMIKQSEEAHEDDISSNQKIEGISLNVKKRGFIGLQTKDYVLSSDESSESDSNSENEGAYPSEDSDGFVERSSSESDHFLSDDD